MANLEEANSVKPEKFIGHNFRRWQKQVKYWSAVLGLISALEESQPSKESSSLLNPEQIEYHSYNRILSALSDHLYDVYHATTSTGKELWQALEAAYGIVDAGIDRFTVSNFNGYKMVENKSVGEQIHEYQELLRGVEKKGTKFSEDFKKPSGGSVTLGNDTVAQVLGIRDIELKMTSGKVLVLKEVRHVPNVRRNLISGSSLVQQGYKVVLESKKVVITKNNRLFILKLSIWNPVMFGIWKVGTHKLDENKKDDGLPPTFIDDCSKYCYIYLIKTKDEVFNKFKVYKTEVQNQLERRIKRFRSGRGGEYTLNDLSVFCEEHGIIHQVTAPYSPQSNGVAEKKNRTLLDMKKRVDNLQVLKVWGCLVKVAIPEPKRKKTGPKTVDSVFLGYAHNSSANRFLVINSEISEISNKTILESRDATYFEDIFPFKTRIQKQVVDRSISNNGSDKASTSTNLPVVNEEEPQAEPRRNAPTTYREVMISIDAPFWKEVINSEVEYILQNNTWELTDLPLGTTPIGYKWVFRKKLKPDGSIDKYKARLVAKGFTQKKGIDYFDTYSLVSRTTTIRTLIALASIHNLVVHQMDVKTSFLNGDLDEEIYMEQPEGFIVKGQEHKSYLARKFDMKDLGEAYIILGMKLERTQDGFTLNQSSSIEKMLKKFNYFTRNPVSTPYDPSVSLKKNNGEPVSQLKYSQMIGSLMYIANKTKADKYSLCCRKIEQIYA
ncbi:unnamed protein product [Prunus armeniaca]